RPRPTPFPYTPLFRSLADHDDVRVLPQERAERAGEGEPDLRLHVDLVDPGDLVLHRILGREDVDVRAVDAVQAGVQRRRLAASRSEEHTSELQSRENL